MRCLLAPHSFNADTSSPQPRMLLLLPAHHTLCVALIHGLLYVALLVDRHRIHFPREVRRWHGSVSLLLALWLRRPEVAVPRPPAGVRAHNRIPANVEEAIVRLHVDQPMLGAGQLRHLAQRLCGFSGCRETVRKIILRNKADIGRLPPTGYGPWALDSGSSSKAWPPGSARSMQC